MSDALQVIVSLMDSFSQLRSLAYSSKLSHNHKEFSFALSLVPSIVISGNKLSYTELSLLHL